MHRLLCLVLLLSWASLSHAATYHVSKQGSDSNSCSSAQRGGSQAKATVAGGVGCLSGGDTLRVDGGTYHEGLTGMPSGSSAAPTVVQAAPGATVWLQPTSSLDCTLLIDSGRSYITIDRINIDSNKIGGFGICTNDEQVHHIVVRNFELKNSRVSGVFAFGHHLEFRNLHIHHNGEDLYYDHGLYFSASDSLVDSNTIHDNAGYGFQNYSSPSTGITPTRNTYTNNLIYNQPSGGAWLIQGTDHVFAQNVIWNSATQPNSGALVCCGSNTQVVNNTIVQGNGTGVVVLNGNDRGAKFENNLVYGFRNGLLQGITHATQSGWVHADPQFQMPGSDFKLKPGSPALRAGMLVAAMGIMQDMEGTARPAAGPIDLGSYQQTGGEGPPPAVGSPAPRNLRLLGSTP
jgi:Right handed beta helix region